LSWRADCSNAMGTIKRLLPRFFDPLEGFTAPEYFELARNLLELYRCEKLLGLEERKPEEIDNTLIMLRSLIELSANTVIEKYCDREYGEKLRESLKSLGESEVKMLNEYLKLGIQLVGYNLPPLVPFLSDKLFIQYLGSVLKVSAIIVASSQKIGGEADQV